MLLLSLSRHLPLPLYCFPPKQKGVEHERDEEVDADDDGDQPPRNKEELGPLSEAGRVLVLKQVHVPVVDYHHVKQHDERGGKIVEIVRIVAEILIGPARTGVVCSVGVVILK